MCPSDPNGHRHWLCQKEASVPKAQATPWAFGWLAKYTLKDIPWTPRRLALEVVHLAIPDAIRGARGHDSNYVGA
jgi:hypothetical protein